MGTVWDANQSPLAPFTNHFFGKFMTVDLAPAIAKKTDLSTWRPSSNPLNSASALANTRQGGERVTEAINHLDPWRATTAAPIVVKRLLRAQLVGSCPFPQSQRDRPVGLVDGGARSFAAIRHHDEVVPVPFRLRLPEEFESRPLSGGLESKNVRSAKENSLPPFRRFVRRDRPAPKTQMMR
jgi:hypothetical protein